MNSMIFFSALSLCLTIFLKKKARSIDCLQVCFNIPGGLKKSLVSVAGIWGVHIGWIRMGVV